MSKWIKFDFAGTTPSGKTKRWYVKTTDNTTLGIIQWFAKWRKYAFSPAYPTFFEEDCLRDIASFCESQTQSHRSIPKQ